MRDTIRASIERAVERWWDFATASAALVTYHEPGGEETDLLCVRWTDEGRDTEGLEIDQAGVREQRSERWVFLRNYLVEQEVTAFAPDGWFLAGTERWDLAEGRPINVSTGPIGDHHPLVIVAVRRAVEPNSSVPGTGFTYDEDDEE